MCSKHIFCRTETPYICNACKETWDVQGTEQLGEWESDFASDLICPECGSKETEANQ